MAQTRNFSETVVARMKREPKFARALLDEALTLFLNGEPETAKLMLRDLVNATMENLSAILVAMKEALHVDIKAVVKAA